MDWDKYKTGNVPGVRWHPCGAFRVQFSKKNHAHNFRVHADLYFRIGQYGFEEAKVGYWASTAGLRRGQNR